ncbi:hypothetical protein B0H17DRAFT_1213422 [Mycena rosella]|uniref:Uncharacterized protein n=1 Tax=Mycena rosella TaxID=1033263 RepID=A0AAD7CQ73_MYCRO|nr:hypothetical protein B0H17DRAFT_1213422 [Mycena rosella]
MATSSVKSVSLMSWPRCYHVEKFLAVYAAGFFPTGDSVWLPLKELKCLTTADIKVFVSNAGMGT